jgi:transmembrane sensor
MLQKKIDKECDEDLLKKYYQNRCSSEEIQYVEQCFVDLKHYGEASKVARQEWNETSLEGNKRGILTDILHKIHFDIRLEEFRKSKERRWLKKTKSVLLGISAAVLIPLLLLNIWQWQNKALDSKPVFTEITAPNGSRVQFNLPDGSSGWLNSGSSLKFQAKFTGKERIVVLNGEAYFNVIEDLKRNFVVSTKYSQVRALGTSFNVLSYSDLDAIEEVTLESGTVRIEKVMKDGSISKVLQMKPGQHVQMDHRSNSIKSTQNETAKYTAWTNGRLIFRNDPLERVIMNLKRYYNVEIEVKDEELFKFHFHATFEDETLYETLRLLKLSSAIDYKILQREKNLNGSYKKRKIILRQKTR